MEWTRYLQDNQTEYEDDDGAEPVLVLVLLLVLLFFFLTFMTASINLSALREKFKNKGVVVGLLVQFFLSPIVGFITIKLPIFDDALTLEDKIVLMTILSSPGGTVSNFLCSLFNVDLGLSVSMSAISTLASVLFLPFNMFVYVKHGIGEEVTVSYLSLSYSVICVVVAVLAGMYLNTKFKTQKSLDRLNNLGTFFGMLILLQGLVFSQTEESFLSKGAPYIFANFFPVMFLAVLGFGFARLSKLEKPESIAVTIECVCQNTPIAQTMAVGTFPLRTARRAINVCVTNGFWQILTSIVILSIAHKAGWGLAPPNEKWWKVLVRNYQPGIEGQNLLETQMSMKFIRFSKEKEKNEPNEDASEAVATVEA